jgi:hypothetical protein
MTEKSAQKFSFLVAYARSEIKQQSSELGSQIKSVQPEVMQVLC